jgi:anti-sigma factor RsiW
VNEKRNHPTPERLQQLVEESLDREQRLAVESHVQECPDCRVELEEVRSLFGALATLPRFAPSPGFADLVMARVRVRQPAFAGVNAWIERVTPHTTRGWAAAAAVLALPVIGATILVTWLLSRPGVTPQGLWTVATHLVEQGVSSGSQWAWARFAGTSLATWLAQAADLVQTVGGYEIGMAAVLFATLTAGSTYVLYQNLFRPEARRNENATYVF